MKGEDIMKHSKLVVDAAVRAKVAEMFGFTTVDGAAPISANSVGGVVTVEVDGTEYTRAYEVRVIATAPIEDVSAEEQHEARVEAYERKTREAAEKKAAAAEEKARKIAKKKEKEAEKAKKEEEGE